MKVNLKEEGIRKTLALLPADNLDPDVAALRDTLEKRLDDVQGNDQLTAVELETVIDVCGKSPFSAQHRRTGILEGAVTKLASLLAKTRAREAAEA